MSLEQMKEHLVPGCHYACTWCAGRGPDNPFSPQAAPPSRCPPLEHFRFESFSPRGRYWLTMGKYLGKHPIDESVIKSMYTCMSCGVCDDLCNVHPGKLREIFREMRKEIVAQGLGPPPACRKVDQNLVATRNHFGSPVENRPKWAEGLDLPEKGDTLYFAGCYTSWRYREIGRGAVSILRGAGVNPAYLGETEGCCGMHAYWDGQEDVAVKLAKHNIEAMKSTGAQRVVFSCAGCYRTFKLDYPKLLGQELPFETVHLAEFAAPLVEEGSISFDKPVDIDNKPVDMKVTFHDPCQLGRTLGVYEDPRKVLKAIPGLEVVEMERHGEHSWCCGDGCQVVSTAYPDLAQATARERVAEAKSAADVLVTACPRCYESLSRAARKENAGMQVVDLAVLMAQAMAKEKTALVPIEAAGR